jgi:hypothetical protein
MKYTKLVLKLFVAACACVVMVIVFPKDAFDYMDGE